MADAGAMDEQTALMNDEGADHNDHTKPAEPAEPADRGPSGGADLPPPFTSGASSRQQPWYRQPVSRDTTDDMLGGVVAGLCRTYGFDRKTTRIALVLAALVVPVLVLVYVLAWILLPDAPAEAQPLADIAADRRRLPLFIVLGLLVVAGGFGSLGSWFLFGDFPWGVGLIAIGVLLWMAPSLRRQRSEALPPPTVGPMPAAGAAGVAGVEGTPRVLPSPVGIADAGAAPQPGPADATSAGRPLGTTASDGRLLAPPATVATTPRRRRIPIGSITALAVIAFVGIASSGDSLDWWDIPVLGVVVTSLIALAVGLAISTVVNGAWFFVPLVLVLGAAAGFLVTADPSLDGGVGERIIRPGDVAQAEAVHDLAIGELTLDLVDLPLDGDDPVTVTAEVGVGRLHVIVPTGATVELSGEVGAGQMTVGEREVFAGVRHEDRRTLPALGEATGTIVLDVRVGIGQIDIDRDVFAVATSTTGTTGTTGTIEP